MDKVLILFRGLPGSGKTTLASTLTPLYFEADRYFDCYHGGEFKPDKIKYAHEWCKGMVEDSMIDGEPLIGVSNTFTRKWEMVDYKDLAEKYGYTVFHIIVENRHGNKSVHNVPELTLNKMKDRFEVEL